MMKSFWWPNMLAMTNRQLKLQPRVLQDYNLSLHATGFVFVTRCRYWAVDNENVKLSAQDELEHKDTRKILFCSRTHSQLHQLINELKKTKFAKEPNPLALISLGSRKQLCINESVRKLKDVARMNDKCVDLQKGNAMSVCIC